MGFPGIGKSGADLQNFSISGHVRFEHGFFQFIDRRGIMAQSEVFDGFEKEIVARGEQLVAMERLEVDRTDDDRHARIAARGPLDQDAGDGGVLTGENETYQEFQRYGDGTSQIEY